MKVLGVISTTAVFLLLGATVPAFAQEDHQEEGAKPAQHEEQAKPAAKQEQTKPQKQEAQANPAKQEQAKPQKQEEQQQAKGQQQQQEKQQQQQAKSAKQEQQQQETKQSNSRSRLSRTKRKVSSTNKPMAKRNNHRGSTHGTVRKIATDTNITKVILVLTIMPASRKMAGATTTDAASTLTAAIGSMQGHIRRGFTSRTCTSLWERMGYGMQWPPATLL